MPPEFMTLICQTMIIIHLDPIYAGIWPLSLYLPQPQVLLFGEQR